MKSCNAPCTNMTSPITTTTCASVKYCNINPGPSSSCTATIDTKDLATIHHLNNFLLDVILHDDIQMHKDNPLYAIIAILIDNISSS